MDERFFQVLRGKDVTQKRRVEVISTVVQDESEYLHEIVVDKKGSVADSTLYVVVMGAEYDGVSKWVREQSDRRVKIRFPNNEVDSFNVGVAASLFFFHLARCD